MRGRDGEKVQLCPFYMKGTRQIENLSHSCSPLVKGAETKHFAFSQRLILSEPLCLGQLFESG